MHNNPERTMPESNWNIKDFFFIFYCKDSEPVNSASGLSLSNFQDDAEELRVHPTKKSVPIGEEKDARKESSKSSFEEPNSDCFKEISSTDEGRHSMYIFTFTCTF